jgi:hypothetical protein
MAKFSVEQRVETRPGKFIVNVRCLSDVAVGERFLLAIPYTAYVDKNQVHTSYWPPQRVDVVIVEITGTYGHKFSTISAGMTAEVVLEGEDDLRPTPCIMLTSDEALTSYTVGQQN